MSPRPSRWLPLARAGIAKLSSSCRRGIGPGDGGGKPDENPPPPGPRRTPDQVFGRDPVLEDQGAGGGWTLLRPPSQYGGASAGAQQLRAMPPQTRRGSGRRSTWKLG